MKFPSRPLPAQFDSASTVLTWEQAGRRPTLADLKRLPRIGDETAATLLVYLFGEPHLIYDIYMSRIAQRHIAPPGPGLPRRMIESVINPWIQTRDDAHRIHARANEIGVQFCHARNPVCADCPLGKYLPQGTNSGPTRCEV